MWELTSLSNPSALELPDRSGPLPGTVRLSTGDLSQKRTQQVNGKIQAVLLKITQNIVCETEKREIQCV